MRRRTKAEVFVPRHTRADGREMTGFVLRAGRLISAGRSRDRQYTDAGHTVLLCVRGAGFIHYQERIWPVRAGDIGWVRGDVDSAHWSAEPHSPSELYWIHVEGAQLNRLYDALAIVGAPVISRIDAKAAAAAYQRIARVLLRRPAGTDAALQRELAALLRLVAKSRRMPLPAADRRPDIPSALQRPMDVLRWRHGERLRVSDMARTAGMSLSSFFRTFKSATGTTPLHWLKRQRLNEATRRLIETDEKLAEIAETLGYYDQFHFSRDFKRATGVAPSEFRSRERTPPGSGAPRSAAHSEVPAWPVILQRPRELAHHRPASGDRPRRGA